MWSASSTKPSKSTIIPLSTRLLCIPDPLRTRKESSKILRIKLLSWKNILTTKREILRHFQSRSQNQEATKPNSKQKMRQQGSLLLRKTKHHMTKKSMPDSSQRMKSLLKPSQIRLRKFMETELLIMII